MGDALGAVCDYTAVITHAAIMETHQEAAIDAGVFVPAESSPLELMGRALVDRGRARAYLGDQDGALRDIASVQQLAGISPQIVTRSWSRLAEVHLLAGRYPAVLDAVQQCVRRSAIRGYLRTLSAFGLLAMGQPYQAIYECDQGLSWVRSTAQLDFLEKHLQALVQQNVALVGLAEIRDRLNWRREELKTYAPTRVSDGGF